MTTTILLLLPLLAICGGIAVVGYVLHQRSKQ